MRRTLSMLVLRSPLTALLLLASLCAQPAATVDPWVEGLRSYERVLKHVDAEGRVDYAALAKAPADLQAAVKALSAVSAELAASWPEAERLAFLVNAYNAFTIDLIVRHHPIATRDRSLPAGSIRQLDNAWKGPTWQLLQKPRTLDQIEHEMIRGAFKDPRIHMVLVCAALGCPILLDRPYVGKTLDQDFALASRRYAQSKAGVQIDRERKVVRLSRIFEWYGKDWSAVDREGAFAEHGDPQAAVLRFVQRHLPESDAAWLGANRFKIEWIEYDWRLNARP